MKIIVIGFVVTTTELVLYTIEGKTHFISQEDPRLREIVELIKEPIQAGESCEVDLSEVILPNPYHEVEQKTKGVLKFFKAAKSFVTNLLSPKPEPLPEIVCGNIPGTNDQTIQAKVPGKPVDMNKAITEILSHSTPVKSDTSEPTEEETIVAIVDDKTIIEDVELISDHVSNAAQGSSTGMQEFMRRLAEIVPTRNHTVKEVMRFIQRADLPFADDGTIIAYKALNHTSNDSFVDCHSGGVTQKVGSFVHMDENIIDPSKAIQCSQGLHIARRAYLRHFGGTTIVVCKIAPEDIIAVPHNDPDKIRVKGYHILMELSDKLQRLLRQNQPITSEDEGAKIIGACIAGKHTPIIEYVCVSGPRGTQVSITPAKDAITLNEVIHINSEAVVKAAPIAAIDDKPRVETLSPAQINQQTVENQEKDVGNSSFVVIPIKEQIRQLIKQFTTLTDPKDKLETAKHINIIRKNAKVGWTKLGVNPEDSNAIMAILSPTPNTESSVTEVKEKPVSKTVTKKPKAPTPTQIKAEKIEKAKGNFEGTNKEKARHLFHKADMFGLRAFKKEKKLSWNSLGFTEAEIRLIEAG